MGTNIAGISDTGTSTDAIAVTNGGSYLLTPEVVFSAPPTGGTQATGVAIMGAAGTGLSTTNTNVAPGTNDLRRVVGIRITNPGSGYTAAPTVTFVRQSFTGKIAGVPVVNGTGIYS